MICFLPFLMINHKFFLIKSDVCRSLTIRPLQTVGRSTNHQRHIMMFMCVLYSVLCFPNISSVRLCCWTTLDVRKRSLVGYWCFHRGRLHHRWSELCCHMVCCDQCSTATGKKNWSSSWHYRSSSWQWGQGDSRHPHYWFDFIIYLLQVPPVARPLPPPPSPPARAEPLPPPPGPPPQQARHHVQNHSPSDHTLCDSGRRWCLVSEWWIRTWWCTTRWCRRDMLYTYISRMYCMYWYAMPAGPSDDDSCYGSLCSDLNALTFHLTEGSHVNTMFEVTCIHEPSWCVYPIGRWDDAEPASCDLRPWAKLLYTLSIKSFFIKYIYIYVCNIYIYMCYYIYMYKCIYYIHGAWLEGINNAIIKIHVTLTMRW